MKTIYTTFFAVSLSALSFGQVTLTGADLNGVIGESISYTQADWMDPGAGGAAQTWDLSGLNPTTAATVTYATANGSFPATNVTELYSDGSEIYYSNTATGQVMHGINAGGTVITYSNPQTYLEFPLSMSVSGSDTHLATFISGGLGFTRGGSTTWETDGWGTVITPNGTYSDVLRVKLTQTYTDTYSGGIINYYTEVYLWLKAGVHFPIASSANITSDLGGAQYSTYQTGNVGLDALDPSILSVYPNPTDGNVTLAGVTSGDYQVISNDGRIVLQGTINGASTSLDLNQFQSGTYRLVVKQERGILTRQIIKL
jgi:hypothetical protein